MEKNYFKFYRPCSIVIRFTLHSDSNAPCVDHDVRLVGGRVASEGRVEICYNGVWGTVCDNVWENIHADIVCRQLNYSTPGKLRETHLLASHVSISLSCSSCRFCCAWWSSIWPR